MPENQGFSKGTTLLENPELHLIHRFFERFRQTDLQKWLKSTNSDLPYLIHVIREIRVFFFACGQAALVASALVRASIGGSTYHGLALASRDL